MVARNVHFLAPLTLLAVLRLLCLLAPFTGSLTHFAHSLVGQLKFSNMCSHRYRVSQEQTRFWSSLETRPEKKIKTAKMKYCAQEGFLGSNKLVNSRRNHEKCTLTSNKGDWANWAYICLGILGTFGMCNYRSAITDCSSETTRLGLDLGLGDLWEGM